MAMRMRMGEDEISSLPDSVREHILAFLPLRDAAKASVLSTRWRNMWADLPCLVLDESFCPIVRDRKDQNAMVDKLMLNLCTVLFLHHGPLREVSLSLSILRKFPDQVERILTFLQRKCSIDSLTITIERQRHPCEKMEYYKLSRRLFSSSFSHLKALRLSCCELVSSPESTFEVFHKLTLLELRNVIIKNAHSSALWSFSCPLLSALTLDGCDCPDANKDPHFVIEAPKLSVFHFAGKFSAIHLKHTPLIKTAILQCSTFEEVKNIPSKLRRIWGDHLASVQSLSVSFPFFLLPPRDEALVLKRWEMLRDMTLNQVCLSRYIFVWTALLLIVISPKLQRLTLSLMKITAARSDTSVAIERLLGGEVDMGKLKGIFENRKLVLGGLKMVEVKSLNGAQPEMGFIGWLLRSSPALDKMEIQLSTAIPAAKKMRILTELNGFRRASTGARIVVN